METDLFTNVNKLCPSCDTWSAQAGKLLANVHVPKPVSNLHMSCVQAWTLLVHWSYCLDTPYTLELLLGHSLYTGATAWTFLVHWSYCLGTPCTLHRYCLDTPCTLELLLGHSLYTIHRYCLDTPCAPHSYYLGTPCAHSV